MLEMTDLLAFGAHFAIVYVLIFTTYLGYKEFTRPNPLTFLELFIYIEKNFDELEEIIKLESKETQRQSFENSLRKHTRKKNKNDNEH